MSGANLRVKDLIPVHFKLADAHSTQSLVTRDERYVTSRHVTSRVTPWHAIQFDMPPYRWPVPYNRAGLNSIFPVWCCI
jgi:hypothetical protein